MNESIHGEKTASEPQDRVTELIDQQTAISEVLRAIANSPHDLQPIFDAILDSATRLCRADLGTLRLSEESGLRLVAMRGDPLLVSQAWSSFPVLAEKGSLPSRFAASRLKILHSFRVLPFSDIDMLTGNKDASYYSLYRSMPATPRRESR